jgi:hypothetical protein
MDYCAMIYEIACMHAAEWKAAVAAATVRRFSAARLQGLVSCAAFPVLQLMLHI